ncbi:MAG: hypothetical protein M0035_16530 [Actinomycetota bacterium]|nr:hypothetical protein [Actinomycetota bacterium]
MLAVDLDGDRLAATASGRDGGRHLGEPVGQPLTLPVALAGLCATARDGHLRAAISTLIVIAEANGCRVVVIEDLDLKDSREMGREPRGPRRQRPTTR